ncbi:phosphatase PAP2 family protein [Streptomyces canus]|uniref:phosphatase PAP2 family protein n=1 Tax=Streptomyces canus TaxID=58343 RepID=UPI0030DFBA45
MHDENHRLARRAIAWGPPWVRQTTPAVREAAEHTKLWWAVPAAMATFGGWRGRTAAAAGVAAMTMAHVLSNAMAKRLYRRRRPPREQVPPEELRERPDSSSFPSGQTAAATAFASTVTPVWPTAGAACGPSASMVSAERVRSGAPYPFGVAAAGVIGLAAAVLVLAAPHLPWRRRF